MLKQIYQKTAKF